MFFYTKDKQSFLPKTIFEHNIYMHLMMAAGIELRNMCFKSPTPYCSVIRKC